MSGIPRTFNFRLPEEAFIGLSKIIQHRDKLPLLTECAAKVGPGTGFDKIARHFSDTTNTPITDASAIVTTLWNLCDFRRELDLSESDLLAALTGYLERNASEDWKNTNLENWKNIIPDVETVVEADSAFALDHKSVRLTYAHQNVLTDADMITDLRPVFSKDGLSIKGMVVSHQVLIEYHDGNEPKRLHVVLDSEDVKKLAALCQRAELKALTVKKSLASQIWITAIAGTEETKQ